MSQRNIFCPGNAFMPVLHLACLPLLLLLIAAPYPAVIISPQPPGMYVCRKHWKEIPPSAQVTRYEGGGRRKRSAEISWGMAFVENLTVSCRVYSGVLNVRVRDVCLWLLKHPLIAKFVTDTFRVFVLCSCSVDIESGDGGRGDGRFFSSFYRPWYVFRSSGGTEWQAATTTLNKWEPVMLPLLIPIPFSWPSRRC